ncbi:hypothetical protein AMIS_29580 [Actinoplanes missouriensis 431]|uniref:Uncharacterized protein n=1 Tax=Actinoplanes missouriensis (strain ATCC 14538 / DSM 43046 / CBS 188.64 / JCM 3121 / NBRC 102363 / NCIMB 12654 / NRRL B-3342 / UNCC 431) TaxID=512565 RepID=I0H591_ACTM4|nr:hypothetical protein AMIS_29580 [Actinoplanes missouriensis 431]
MTATCVNVSGCTDDRARKPVDDLVRAASPNRRHLVRSVGSSGRNDATHSHTDLTDRRARLQVGDLTNHPLRKANPHRIIFAGVLPTEGRILSTQSHRLRQDAGQRQRSLALMRGWPERGQRLLVS